MSQVSGPEAPSAFGAKVARWAAMRRAQVTAVTVRAGVGVLEAVAPPLAGAAVERLWFRPPRASAAAMRRHADLLADAEPLSLRVNGREVRGWTLGEGPQVLLVHGWGGWAAQLAPIARALASSGVAASAVDLPAHGSDPVRRNDAFESAAALRALAADRGAPALIVAHSFGALAAALAFQHDPPPAAVLLAPALATTAAIVRFGQMLRLRPATVDDLQARLMRYTGDAWPLINRGADFAWPGGPLLVIHDRDDPQTPFALSAALAARRSDVDLLEVSGSGHYRLLRDPEIVRVVARFAADHVVAQRA
jgi:pimeloyl-ACP methyl ester carboxylesterase